LIAFDLPRRLRMPAAEIIQWTNEREL